MSSIPETAEFLGVSPSVFSAWRSKAEDPAPLPADLANVGDVRQVARWLANQCDALGRALDPRFSQDILDRGFIAGLVFCGLAFVATVVYLSVFLGIANSDFNVGSADGNSGLPVQYAFAARLITIRLALLACGVLAGSALGFLGLSLFLMGVRSVMNVDAQGGSFQTKLVNVAPGTLVLLCAALLIGLCTNRDISWKVDTTGAAGVTNPTAGQPTATSMLVLMSANSTTMQALKKELADIHANLQPDTPDQKEAEARLAKLKERVYYISLLCPEIRDQEEKNRDALKAKGAQELSQQAEKRRLEADSLTKFFEAIALVKPEASAISNLRKQLDDITKLAP
jgi:hypothetical protein